MANASVERFKKLTQELQREVHDAAVDELRKQAGDLATLIESVAPRDKGVLIHTIHVVPDKTKDTVVRVVAGDGSTLRRGVTSKPYQYPRADEFGTINMPAKAFFFPTYRLRKKKIIATMKRRLTASIKKRSAE